MLQLHTSNQSPRIHHWGMSAMVGLLFFRETFLRTFAAVGSSPRHLAKSAAQLGLTASTSRARTRLISRATSSISPPTVGDFLLRFDETYCPTDTFRCACETSLIRPRVQRRLWQLRIFLEARVVTGNAIRHPGSRASQTMTYLDRLIYEVALRLLPYGDPIVELDDPIVELAFPQPRRGVLDRFC